MYPLSDMKIKLKNKYFIFFTVLCISLGLVIYYTGEKPLKPVKEEISAKELSKVVKQFMFHLEKRWAWGDLENYYSKKMLNCPDLILFDELVTSHYLSCNPRYLQCYFASNTYKKGKYEIKLESHEFKKEFMMNFTVWLNSKFIYKFAVNLKRKCQQVLLPEGSYFLETLGGNWWSNKGRKIYIDKFLVSRNDINLWKGKSIYKVEEGGYPALDLSLSEKKKYCGYYGKKLLKAHFFEAAIRFPSDDMKKLNPYPWNLYSQNSLQGLKKQKISEALCRKAYLKECREKFQWKSYDTDAVSWLGIYQIFGGPVEEFDNIYEPHKKYKLASWDISFKSDKAKIGFEKASYQQAGFRCYQEIGSD